jgi:hypothetical protein|eukprot:COSAG06_NODE_394_length_16313_cov_11.756568_8_plen_61_part_00
MPSLVAIDEPYTEELQAELLDSLKTKGFCVCVRAEPPDRLPQVARCLTAVSPVRACEQAA